ncbi:unnamed protein product, partial [Ixodes hexagonus]
VTGFAVLRCASMGEDPQEEILRRYVKDLSLSDNKWVGYVESEEVLRELEKSLANIRIQFSTTTSRSHKSGTSTPMFRSKRGSVHVSLNMPFQVLYQADKGCVFGTGRRIKTLNENNGDASSRRDESTNKGRMTRRSKKTGCTAAMSLKWIRVYPDFQVEIPPGTGINKSQEKRAEAIRNLEACQHYNAKNMRHKLRIYIRISAIGDHSGHGFEETAASNQTLNKEVSLKIRDLVHEGITSVREVKEHLHQYVHDVLFHGQEIPDETCRAFFPRNEIIHNHVQAALRKHRLSSADLDSCRCLVEKWAMQDPESKFFFQSQQGTSQVDGQSEVRCGNGQQVVMIQQQELQLLFCYQSKFMRDLMSRYGNGAMRLDMANKSNELSLPVFFVSVGAPRELMTVGVFVLESETTECIIEALRVFCRWCPSFEPSRWTVDHHQAEIGALRSVFPESKVVMCDFRRDQSWDRWTRKFKNEVQDRKLVISLLRNIADSTSEQDLTEALSNLRSSEVWKNEKLRTYVETQWLPIKETWAKVYSSDSGPGPADGGTEQENRLLKELRSGHCRKSLTALVSALVENLLPAQQQEHEREHSGLPSPSNTGNKSIVPDYLHGRPPAFVSHVLSRLTAAVGYTTEDIVPLSADGCFYVRSLSSTDWCTVDFGIPSCSCTDFVQSRLPCEHFCAVFALVDGWSLDNLPGRYLDEQCVSLHTTSLSKINKGHRSTLENVLDDPLASPASVTPSANEIDMCLENDIFDSALSLPTATVDVLDIPLCPTAPTLDGMRQELRGLLERCGDLLTRCSDPEAMGSAMECLEDVCDMLSGSASTSAPVPARNSQQDNDLLSAPP